MSMDPRPLDRLRRLSLVLVALAAALAFGCGIDEDDDGDDTGGSSPDLSGTYVGFFFSQETDEAIAVDQAVFIRVSDSTYRVDFDIDTEDGEDATAVALEAALNLDTVEGVVSGNEIFIDAGNGALVMSGRVRDGRLDGDWLLAGRFGTELIEDSGTWDLTRQSR